MQTEVNPSKKERTMKKTLKSAVTGSLKRATRMLNMVDLSSLTQGQMENVGVSCYSNGREQGYAVTLWGHIGQLKLVFTEARGSDDIIVYKGGRDDFDDANVPSEEIYRKQMDAKSGEKRFSSHRSEEAAEECAARFITQTIEKFFARDARVSR